MLSLDLCRCSIRCYDVRSVAHDKAIMVGSRCEAIKILNKDQLRVNSATDGRESEIIVTFRFQFGVKEKKKRCFHLQQPLLLR